jgi:hypothetical protein
MIEVQLESPDSFGALASSSASAAPAAARSEFKQIRTDAQKRTAKISLQDCLACSGCITSAETVLVMQQSLDEFYASLAADRGARVILSIQDELLSLFRTFDPRVEVIGARATPPAFDEHISLMSLPGAFGTTLETLPGGPAYLRADPALTAAWAERLGPRTRPRVGLVWSGSPHQVNDRNRSAPLADLLPVLSENLDWISLQKDVREADLPVLAANPRLRDVRAGLTDFAETAALMDNLDLVISVCTAPAHLAGALGRPCWVMLAFNADWRWFQGRDDSPWYPAARLFRQPAPGAWGDVADQVRQALAADRHLSN